ncbi:hypothetical protein LZ30DRAFT_368987 [Colletotrichum cereale]|nr:hypothetical protein LZ30DRAFT_368987 [Colletotrichum cereale]
MRKYVSSKQVSACLSGILRRFLGSSNAAKWTWLPDPTRNRPSIASAHGQKAQVPADLASLAKVLDGSPRKASGHHWGAACTFRLTRCTCSDGTVRESGGLTLTIPATQSRSIRCDLNHARDEPSSAAWGAGAARMERVGGKPRTYHYGSAYPVRVLKTPFASDIETFAESWTISTLSSPPHAK